MTAPSTFQAARNSSATKLWLLWLLVLDTRSSFQKTPRSLPQNLTVTLAALSDRALKSPIALFPLTS